MNSFKCSKCAYKTIRNHDLTRHLKNVHGIYAKGYNQPQAGIPSRVTEEKQFKREPHRHFSEEEGSNTSESNSTDGLSKQIDSSEEDDDVMRKRKCRILDCILDTIPEHLKTKAKNMCDVLKCKSQFSILPSYEILIDGEVDRGSNVRDYIMDSLVEPPMPGTPRFRLLEKENERLKQNLAYYEKALAKARGVSRCRKFESIIDNTVERCDFSDDTYSDESSVENEEEDDSSVENDEDDDSENDAEEENDEEEPIKKRKK